MGQKWPGSVFIFILYIIIQYFRYSPINLFLIITNPYLNFPSYFLNKNHFCITTLKHGSSMTRIHSLCYFMRGWVFLCYMFEINIFYHLKYSLRITWTTKLNSAVNRGKDHNGTQDSAVPGRTEGKGEWIEEQTRTAEDERNVYHVRWLSGVQWESGNDEKWGKRWQMTLYS